jgi:hypothetical protein
MEEESAPIKAAEEQPVTIRNDLKIFPPSGDMTRQIVIYRNTWVRLTTELRQCKLYGAGVLSNLASGSFGIALSAGVQTAIIYNSTPPTGLGMWAGVTSAGLFATGVFAFCAHYVRRRENASLQSVIDEMEEHRERWG